VFVLIDNDRNTTITIKKSIKILFDDIYLDLKKEKNKRSEKFGWDQFLEGIGANMKLTGGTVLECQVTY